MNSTRLAPETEVINYRKKAREKLNAWANSHKGTEYFEALAHHSLLVAIADSTVEHTKDSIRCPLTHLP